MLYNEDFVRCPKCKSPYFIAKELVCIDKEIMERTKVPTPNKKVINYVCANCGESFGRVEQKLN